ncbi:hypothetical protein HMF7854_10625 [Sphingomonas ginkgonis]|uniref:Uncharacterized protein n=1 Tax=Sphingomonas ginkgonis TaxID=2315330 RepID=A0A429VB73_9SPHN|nr:hypothetical protein [Sphingomonas ginkgonis]RST31239.1 hypothetical protein HMF7854_10625 [Sphingomonas ginkgonis]
MSEQGLSHHPAPARRRVSGPTLSFALWGGPAAWLAQLLADYAIYSRPCFTGSTRNAALPDHVAATHVAGAVALVLPLLVALAAGAVAVRVYRRTRDESAGSSAGLVEAGNGRTRFLSFWGMLMGFGFAILILTSLAAMLMVPPCAM